MAHEYRCEICNELVTGSDDEVLACPAHPSAGVMSCPVATDRVAEVLARYPDATDKRRESIRIAVELGADDDTIAKIAEAGRVGRLGYVTIPGRYLHLSRGKGWARLGRGSNAVWGEQRSDGFRLREAGQWVIYTSDGFKREDRETWDVEMIHVGPQIWAVAS